MSCWPVGAYLTATPAPGAARPSGRSRPSSRRPRRRKRRRRSRRRWRPGRPPRGRMPRRRNCYRSSRRPWRRESGIRWPPRQAGGAKSAKSTGKARERHAWYACHLDGGAGPAGCAARSRFGRTRCPPHDTSNTGLPPATPCPPRRCPAWRAEALRRMRRDLIHARRPSREPLAGNSLRRAARAFLPVIGSRRPVGQHDRQPGRAVFRRRALAVAAGAGKEPRARPARAPADRRRDHGRGGDRAQPAHEPRRRPRAARRPAPRGDRTAAAAARAHQADQGRPRAPPGGQAPPGADQAAPAVRRGRPVRNRVTPRLRAPASARPS